MPRVYWTAEEGLQKPARRTDVSGYNGGRHGRRRKKKEHCRMKRAESASQASRSAQPAGHSGRGQGTGNCTFVFLALHFLYHHLQQRQHLLFLPCLWLFSAVSARFYRFREALCRFKIECSLVITASHPPRSHRKPSEPIDSHSLEMHSCHCTVPDLVSRYAV